VEDLPSDKGIAQRFLFKSADGHPLDDEFIQQMINGEVETVGNPADWKIAVSLIHNMFSDTTHSIDIEGVDGTHVRITSILRKVDEKGYHH
jgi:hypothetical protein